MIALTLGEVAAATGGRLSGGAEPGAEVTGSVEFDSRAVGPGGLFLALVGERADGHDFAEAAVRDGAVAVLATRAVGVPAVIVEDVLVALGRLARLVLDRLPDVTVLALTGSSGKTSTKDLLAALLAGHGETVAPPGSFNNELGLSWTVLRARPGTRYLVLEEGARGVGHIAALCQIAPPQVAAVLNVGSAHLGGFGSVQAIAAAKGELVEALPADGVAVLNVDDPLVAAMAWRTSAPVLRVGTAGDADVRAEDVSIDASGRPSFALVAGGERHDVDLQLHGAHHVANALSAAGMALAVGVEPADIAATLSAATPASPWRMAVSERGDGVTIVNDAYNANPESVAAALRTLAAMSAPAGRRSWAVLGPMAELGDGTARAHIVAGALAAQLGIDRIVALGPDAAAIRDGADAAGGTALAVPDLSTATALLSDELRPGDIVLVKASRVCGLERLAESLLAAGAAGVRT